MSSHRRSDEVPELSRSGQSTSSLDRASSPEKVPGADTQEANGISSAPAVLAEHGEPESPPRQPNHAPIDAINFDELAEKDIATQFPFLGSGANGRLARRTLERRNRDIKRRLAEQLRHGRPCMFWRACGVPGCREIECLNMYDSWTIEDKASSSDGVSVQSCLGEAVARVVDRGWPDLEQSEGPAAARARRAAVQSFVASPPVRRAFWFFREHISGLPCAYAEELEHHIRQARPKWLDSILLADDDDPHDEDHDNDDLDDDADDAAARSKRTAALIHRYIAPSTRRPASTWWMHDLVMNFLVSAETWRQYELRWQPGWAFGPRSTVFAVLAEVLRQLRRMDGEGCFRSLRTGDHWAKREVWEEWLARHGVLGGGDDDDDDSGRGEVADNEVEVFVGLGQHVPVWEPKS